MPEPETIPEAEPTPEPKKRRARTPKPKPKPKRSIPWYRIVRTAVWWAVAIGSVVTLHLGVLGWLGQSAAYITLSVSLIVAAYLLDRDGKRMRNG